MSGVAMKWAIDYSCHGFVEVESDFQTLGRG